MGLNVDRAECRWGWMRSDGFFIDWLPFGFEPLRSRCT